MGTLGMPAAHIIATDRIRDASGGFGGGGCKMFRNGTDYCDP